MPKGAGLFLIWLHEEPLIVKNNNKPRKEHHLPQSVAGPRGFQVAPQIGPSSTALGVRADAGVDEDDHGGVKSSRDEILEIPKLKFA